MDEPPKKRGRGRPRKTPAPAPTPEPAQIEPEEVIFMGAEQAPPAVDEAVEEIQLAGYEPEQEQVPEPEPTPMPSRPEPAVVYVPPPPDAEKEKSRRAAVISKIRRYRESFAAVRAMQFSESWSTDTLESHLDDVRVAVSTKNTGLLVKGVYLAGVKGVEVGSCALGVKAYGLTEVLSRSAEIDGLLKEVACEIGMGHIPATTRLAIATLQTVFVLDSANKKAEALAGFKSTAVNGDLKNRYADI